MATKPKGNAILYDDELQEHFADESNHYLYKKMDDDTLVCWMCCDFEFIRDNEVKFRGGCGQGICYDLNSKKITLEKGN